MHDTTKFTVMLAIVLVIAGLAYSIAGIFLLKVWNRHYVRIGVATSCLMLGALTIETIFIHREDEHITISEQWPKKLEYITEDVLAGELVIRLLVKIKHFADSLPVVVVVPGLIVSLGVYSAEQHLKKHSSDSVNESN